MIFCERFFIIFAGSKGGIAVTEHRRHAGSLTACAMMCALLAVCAQFQLPLPGVPVSLTLFAVHLGAMLLSERQAVMSIVCYLLLGLCGVPVFAGFSSGPAALLGPTGGFLLSYPLCTLVTGRLIRRFARAFMPLFLSGLAGAALCMLLGVLWFMLITKTPLTLPALAYWLLYLPGDAVKCALAALLALRLQIPLRAMGI